MRFSFIFITDGTQDARLLEGIKSIEFQNIPSSDHEIIVVGNTRIQELRSQIRAIPFDESQKPAWITRKKNIGIHEAQFENLVIMHDYLALGNEWYEGWLKFGNDFDIATNLIFTMEGKRHSDWCLNPYDLWEILPQFKDNYDVGLPYEVTNLSRFMYISGAYMVIKKHIALQFPQLETLVWGQGEDCEWARQVRQFCQFKLNTNSSCTLTKPNKWAVQNASQELIDHLQRLNTWIEKYN